VQINEQDSTDDGSCANTEDIEEPVTNTAKKLGLDVSVGQV
jgi:hypothetical protein